MYASTKHQFEEYIPEEQFMSPRKFAKRWAKNSKKHKCGLLELDQVPKLRASKEYIMRKN